MHLVPAKIQKKLVLAAIKPSAHVARVLVDLVVAVNALRNSSIKNGRHYENVIL